MTGEKQENIIDKILGDLSIYLYPELLKEQYKNSLDFSKIKKQNLEKYLLLISNINYAWKKVAKYDIFFQEFYSSSQKIERFEELNHHIHAYLQDMDTLRNKMLNLLGALKNDLKGIASDKKEVFDFIQAGINKTNKIFEGILKYRVQHVHDGMRFLDGELLKAENAHRVIEMFSNSILSETINPDYKPIIIKKLKSDKEESFSEAKNRWVRIAQNNSKQITGFLNSMLGILRPSIYQFLHVKSIELSTNAD